MELNIIPLSKKRISGKHILNFNLNNNKSLQQKIAMDIMLYYGGRGNENLRDLGITDFALTTDGDG